MGFFASLKANRAIAAHNKGDIAKAKQLYSEAIDKEGCLEARPMLGYALLLIREGSYQQAMDLLVKAQKAPDLTPERRSQLFVDYAACCAKTGKLDKGVSLLAQQHAKNPTGLTYQTLGYLYVEQLAVMDKADEAYAERLETARKLLEDAIDYDDEDPVCLDNMGQFQYRILGDKEAARPWFEKAHAEKPGQIDSLWFLSRYDLDAGDVAAAVEKLETALDGRFSPLNFASREDVEAELKRLKDQ